MLIHKSAKPSVILNRVYMPGTFYLRTEWSKSMKYLNLDHCINWPDLPSNRYIEFKTEDYPTWLIYIKNDTVYQYNTGTSYLNKLDIPLHKLPRNDWTISVYNDVVPKEFELYIQRDT